MEPTTNPNHPLNRYPWQHPQSRERKAILTFLKVAEANAQIGRAPFTLAEARPLLDWLHELVKQPHPFSTLPEEATDEHKRD